MNRNAVAGTLVLLAGLISLSGCAGTSRSADGWTTDAPFDWDAEYSSRGTALMLMDTSRTPVEGSTVVEYEFRTIGFDPDPGAVMWMKQGMAYQSFPASVAADGLVTVAGADVFMVGGYVRGQALDVALVSGGKRAHAKDIPFPIEERNGSCRASVEILSPRGLLFLLVFEGFQPGEEARVESRYKGERIERTVTVNEKGAVRMPVVYGPGDRGTATATVTGAECGVSIKYGVGPDALEVQ